MATTTTASDELVILAGGLAVPLCVVAALIDMEFRNIRVRLDPDGMIVAGPRTVVTDADREFIRSHRPAVVAALEYLHAAERQPQ